MKSLPAAGENNLPQQISSHISLLKAFNIISHTQFNLHQIEKWYTGCKKEN